MAVAGRETGEMTGETRMLAACALEHADRTPVWYMRQAGRCLAEYREMRKQYDILTMAKTPELCTQVTLMPVEKMGVDAAVMYADIMLPLEGMGLPFHIEPDIGPIVPDPVRTDRDVERIRVIEAEESTPYVFEAIRLIRKELHGRAALVGFSGSPFTLACYMIEGRPSKDYSKAKSMIYGKPDLWHRLMEKVTEVIVRYLRAQVEAGAQVVQLFDSWVGMLGPEVYEEFVLPYSTRIFTKVRKFGVPSIHFGTGAASLLELMSAAGPDMVSVDWRVPLNVAWEKIGFEKGIQGNLDPAVMLAPWEMIERRASMVLDNAGGRAGHIFNLGHGVLADTDPEKLRTLAQYVHERTARETRRSER